MTKASSLVPSFLQNSNFQADIQVHSANVIALFFQHIENILAQQVVLIREQRSGLSAGKGWSFFLNECSRICEVIYFDSLC